MVKVKVNCTIISEEILSGKALMLERQRACDEDHKNLNICLCTAHVPDTFTVKWHDSFKTQGLGAMQPNAADYLQTNVNLVSKNIFAAKLNHG